MRHSTFFVLFQRAHAEEYSEVDYFGSTSCHWKSWTVTLDELEKLMRLIVARGAIGGKTFPLKSIWNKSWGCPLFNATMPRWRFLKIINFLRFNLKTEKRKNLEVLLLKTERRRNLEKKFCLA